MCYPWPLLPDISFIWGSKVQPHQEPGCYWRSVNMTFHVPIIRWAAMIFTCCSVSSVTVVFFILTNQILILSIRVLPCSCAVLFNMLDARLFLRLQLVPHKEDTLLYHVLGVQLLLQPHYLLQRTHNLVIVVYMATRVCLTVLTYSGLPRVLCTVDELYCIEMWQLPMTESILACVKNGVM